MIDWIWNTVRDQLANNQFSQAALMASGLSGVVMFIWAYLRGIPGFIWSRIDRWLRYSMTVEEETQLHRYLDLWVQTHIPKKLRKVEASLIDDTVVLSHENDYVYTWRNFRRLTISKAKQRLEAAQSKHDAFTRTYHITGLFAKKQISSLVEEVIREGKAYDEARSKRKVKPDIFVVDDWGSW